MNDNEQFFSFFHAEQNGDLAREEVRNWTITTDESTIETSGHVKFIPGIVESFDFGWNKQTTYDHYRRRIGLLLELATARSDDDETCQSLLCASIIFFISGLETLVKTTARLKDAPSQDIDEYVGILKQLDGYRPIPDEDLLALRRLFEARHAIIHNGWNWTDDLKKHNNKRFPGGNWLRFRTSEIQRMLSIADRFADTASTCTPPEDSPAVIQLKPLQQWFCDTCNERIMTLKDGVVEWTRDDQNRTLGFRICHSATASPILARSGKKMEPNCYKYKDEPRGERSLEDITGTRGMARMLAFIDVGQLYDPEAKRQLTVADVRNWTETFRRLFVPYYEEARMHFDAAKAEGFFGGDESSSFTGANLKRLIEKYAGRA